MSSFLLWSDKLYLVLRLMNFVSAVFSLLYVTFFSVQCIKLMHLKYCVLLIDIVCSLRLVSKHFSEFPKFVKHAVQNVIHLRINKLFCALDTIV
jgi:hypothetical protein